LRPDRLGIYGHQRDTSPNIDQFASQSVVFDNAFATTSWTLPSHVSMLTGLYPEVHGVTKGKQRVGENALLCSEQLQTLGYQTLAVVAGPYLRSRFGFNQGWDDYDDYTIKVRGKRATVGGPVTPKQHRRIVDMLDSRDGRPFFLFLHYWDVHYDYDPPPPWNTKFDPDYDGEIDSSYFTSNESIHPEMDPRDLEHILALYDGEIAFTDHYLGLLFEVLRERGLYDDAVIVVTSDHGDEFFEHGQKGHRVNLYNSTLKVPLIIKFPGGRWGGKRVVSPVSLVDIPPTLFDLLGSDRAGAVNGNSVLPLLEKGSSRGPRIVFADLSDYRKAMVGGRWKIVTGMGDGVELYDLTSDPQERSNVVEENREKSEDMLDALQIWLSVANRQARELGRESIEYDDETRLVLESLGYLD
jgi:arylsulfatase A-like enzyme